MLTCDSNDELDKYDAGLVELLLLAEAAARGDRFIAGNPVSKYATDIAFLLVNHPRLNAKPAFTEDAPHNVMVIDIDGPRIRGTDPITKLLNAVLKEPGMATGVAAIHAQRNMSNAMRNETLDWWQRGVNAGSIPDSGDTLFDRFTRPFHAATTGAPDERIAALRLGPALDAARYVPQRTALSVEDIVEAEREQRRLATWTKERMDDARDAIDALKEALPKVRASDAAVPVRVEPKVLLDAVEAVVGLGLSVQEDGRFVLQGRAGLGYGDVVLINDFLRPDGVQRAVTQELDRRRSQQTPMDWTGSDSYMPEWALRPARRFGERIFHDCREFPDIELMPSASPAPAVDVDSSLSPEFGLLG
jgi:hypothetical protein